MHFCDHNICISSNAQSMMKAKYGSISGSVHTLHQPDLLSYLQYVQISEKGIMCATTAQIPAAPSPHLFFSRPGRVCAKRCPRSGFSSLRRSTTPLYFIFSAAGWRAGALLMVLFSVFLEFCTRTEKYVHTDFKKCPICTHFRILATNTRRRVHVIN